MGGCVDAHITFMQRVLVSQPVLSAFLGLSVDRGSDVLGHLTETARDSMSLELTPGAVSGMCSPRGATRALSRVYLGPQPSSESQLHVPWELQRP